MLVYICIILFSTFPAIHAISPDSTSQQVLTIKEFTPPQIGCSVNWVLEISNSCTWCEIMFDYFMLSLTEDYTLFSIYTETNENSSVGYDLKGTCFINWFMATNFEQLTRIIESNMFSKYRKEDWFIFIDVSLI